MLTTDIEQTLNNHEESINQLIANTKWLYKYGGVGGKGGSNSGSSDGSNYNIYCELDEIPINDGDICEVGKHKLKVTVTKHGGLSYNISVKILSKITNKTTNATPSSAVLSLDASYSKEFTVNITENSDIIISATSSDGEPKSVRIGVITDPYVFSLTYNKNNGDMYNISSLVNSELLINDLSLNGFNIVFNYNIAISASIEYKTKSSISSINNLTGVINDTSGLIKFTVDPSFLTYENAGFYTFSLILTIKENNKLPYTNEIFCSFFLIPSSLFLLVYPENDDKKIYYSSDGNEPISSEGKPLSEYYNKYQELINKESLTEEENEELNSIKSEVSYINNGIVGLVGKIYYGGNQQRYFTINNSCVQIYHNENDEEILDNYYLSFSSILERKSFNIAPYINNVNRNKLVFSIKDTNQIDHEFVYYIYTDVNKLSLNWINSDIVIDETNYWRNGKTTSFFNQLNGQSYIDTYSNSKKDIELLNGDILVNDNVDLYMAFGIQYSAINDSDNPILTISSINQIIEIYQNKVISKGNSNVSDSGNSTSIYIPKEQNYNPAINNNYHLLSISIRKINADSSNNTYYQFVIYIDGCIENAFGQYFTNIGTINSIKLKPSNTALNLIDVTYFGNAIQANTNKRQFTESDICQYYYSYCQNYNKENNLYDESSLELLSIFNKMDYNYEQTNLYTLNYQDITTIAKDVDVPVMLLTISLNSNIGVLSGKYGSDLMQWLTGIADENTPKIAVENVSWCSGKGTLQEYKLANYTKTQGCNWYIEIQGSSTKGNKSKNLDLGIDGDDTSVVLFTPNFKNIQSTMGAAEQKTVADTAFLPEQKFTLKADKVDSTHCNNTSIGKFINANTPRFTDAQQPNSKYNSYIKNCLTGFPFLLFLEFKRDTDGNDDSTFYYIGIYNFNLGRDSYFNLGYINFDGLDNHIENVIDESKEHELSDGFGIYVLDNNYNQPIQSLFVTEIQSGSIQGQTHEGGGGNVYDFSQFNASILGIDGKNAGMFGDFKMHNTISASLVNTLPNFVKSVAKAGAYIFMRLKKNIDGDILTSDKPVGDYNIGYSRALDNSTEIGRELSINHVPNFLLEAWRDTSQNNSPVYFRKPNDPNYMGILKDTNFNFDEYLNGTHTTAEMLNDLLDIIPNIDTNITENWLSKPILNIIGQDADGASLYNENVTIDYPSLVYYYVICMGMGLVDSVCKNLNMKSWKASSSTLGRMYTAFYDMDTALGRDNSGNYVSYFAFSDYWTNIAVDNNAQINNLDKINIYRDFFPQTTDNSKIIGYDIPSSYLFAIAKYAQLFIPSTIWQINNYNSPTDIWYQFRLYNSGPLRSADYFIDTYFSNDINKIPEILINYNYRFKYLWHNNSNFISNEIASLHGRGIYSLRDWLANRLHILDAYFNLCSAKDIIQYYDENDETSTYTARWKNINNSLFEPSFSSKSPALSELTNNDSDIIIFKNAFASSDSQITKSSISNIIATVKAPELSPLVLITDATTNSRSTYRYLLNNPDKYYSIHMTNQGSQETIFGGSVLWTEIQEAGYFITTIDTQGTLNCTSSNLEYLRSTLGVCSAFNLNTPSLHTLILNSDKYTGSLTIHGADNKLSNVNLLNINTTHFNDVTLQQSHIQYLYANNTILGSLKIIDCTDIEEFTISGATINTLSYNPVCINKVVTGFTDFGYKYQNENIYLLELTDSNIQNIELTNKQYDNAGIIISNNKILEDLTLVGFTYIIIQGCPKLSNITIRDNEFKVKSLSIKSCYPLSSNVLIADTKIDYVKDSIKVTLNDSETSSDLQNVDLSTLSGLEAISFENTWFIESVTLPNKTITLLDKAFNKVNIRYINFADNTCPNDRYLILEETSDTGIFEDSCFNLQGINKSMGQAYDLYFKVSDYCKSLKNLFKINKNKAQNEKYLASPAIQLISCIKFINNLQNKANLENISYMFYNQTNISLVVGDDGKLYDNVNGMIAPNNLFTLSDYTNVTDISNMFTLTDMRYICNEMFSMNGNTVGGNNDINIVNFAIPNNISNLIYVHEHAFDSLYDRYTTFYADVPVQESTPELKNTYSLLIVKAEDGNIIESDVSIRNIITPADKTVSTKLNKLVGFTVMNKTIDFANMFDDSINTTLKSILFCLNKFDSLVNISNINNINLNKLSELLIFYKSFEFVNNKNNRINIANFIDLTHLDKIYTANTNAKYTDANIFNFYKELDYDNQWESVWGIIKDFNNISHLFNKCNFNIQSTSENILSIPNIGIQTEIANYLFGECTFIKDGEDVGIKLTSTSLSAFTNLRECQYMFANSKFDNSESYIIPENIFSGLNALKTVRGMFRAITFTEVNGYRTYNTGLTKDCYYVYQIIGHNEHNYMLYDSTYNSYSKTIESWNPINGYPILPPNIFKNTHISNVSEFIYNSPFEGYLPDTLYKDTNVEYIDNIIWNCKVLPQYYGETTNTNNFYNITNKTIKLYTFIPENYLNSNIKSLNGLCGFKLLAQLNDNNSSATIVPRLYLLCNSFINGNTSLSTAKDMSPTVFVEPISGIPTQDASILNESLITQKIYVDIQNNAYAEFNYSDGSEQILPFNVEHVSLNIMIGKYTNEQEEVVYKEGLDIQDSYFIHLPLEFISPIITSILDGYLFVHDTEITTQNITQIISIYKAIYLNTKRIEYKLSSKLILPHIHILNSPYDNLSTYAPGADIKDNFNSATNSKYNQYYKPNYLFKLNNAGQSYPITIQANQIDGIAKDTNYYDYILEYIITFNPWISMITQDSKNLIMTTMNTINVAGETTIINANNITYTSTYNWPID